MIQYCINMFCNLHCGKQIEKRSERYAYIGAFVTFIFYDVSDLRSKLQNKIKYNMTYLHTLPLPIHRSNELSIPVL